MPDPLIILGRHVRAAAQSAVRAGYEPWCIDTADTLDLRDTAGVTIKHCPAEKYPAGMLPMLADAPYDAKVMLTADLENHPEFVDAVAIDRQLLGCSPEAIRSVRRADALAGPPAIAHVRFSGARTKLSWFGRIKQFLRGKTGTTRYLLKPVHGYDGRGIEWYTGSAATPEDHYIQQYVRGTPLSAVYHTDGWSAILVGVTEQLIGEASLGAARFQYCGSITPVELSEDQRAGLAQLGVVLAQQHDLRGLFGIDLVLDKDGDLWPVEVNPRYTDSVELIEQHEHIAALHGRAAIDKKSRRAPGPAVLAKVILRARADTTAPDLRELLPDARLADIPAPGSAIKKGERLCTAYAGAPTRDACLVQLKQLASRVYEGKK
jgi:hypothetical protein